MVSIIYHVIGLEGCGHHGLEKVIVDIIKQDEYYLSGGVLNKAFSLKFRNKDNLDIIEKEVKNYIDGKTFLLYIDDSYPSMDNREIETQKNIVKMNEIVNKYGKIKFIYLKRNIYNAINAHSHFDGGILGHTKKMIEMKKYIEDQMNTLKNINVEILELNYEDIDNDTGVNILAKYLDVSIETVKKSVEKNFKKSKKDYKNILDEKIIKEMSEIIDC
jgi:tRNA nucleotidyltransferase/poly(A) polymerase